MSEVFEILITMAALALLVPVSILTTEILFALPRYGNAQRTSPRFPKTAILIPAHDEAAVIAETLGALQPQLSKYVRLVVVADNCTDNTALIAKNLGAEVIERNEPDKRGKGFALAHGVSFLASEPPDVLVIIDADCHAQEGVVDLLAEMAWEHQRPVQACYLMQPPENAGPNQQVSALAFKVRNYVRLLGMMRMGLPCPLVGTGMAFPWNSIETAQLRSDNLVEDMKLGIDMVRLGHPPMFCPQAKVTSRFPEVNEAARVQRTRWEHGHLQMILSQIPQLVLNRLRHRDWAGVAFALDLAVPPLSLLLWFMIVALLLTGVAHISGLAAAVPLIIAIGATSLFAASLLIAWWLYGREILPPRALAALPGYVGAKSLLYLQFVFRRQKDWVRTDRD